MESTPPRRFERYVAIGDSSTEGLDDPDGAGGYRGWANRLAERIAKSQGSLLYANLGIRGRRTRQIRDEQLERACAMRPDLATVFSGTNDVVARRFDADAVAADAEHLQRTLIAAGATVLTFTLPDLTPVMPMARLIGERVRTLNTRLRAISAQTGALLVDFAAASDATADPPRADRRRAPLDPPSPPPLGLAPPPRSLLGRRLQAQTTRAAAGSLRRFSWLKPKEPIGPIRFSTPRSGLRPLRDPVVATSCVTFSARGSQWWWE